MLFLLIASTAVYGLSCLYGTAVDAILVASSLAVLCGWLPRVFYGFVFTPKGHLLDRLFRKDSTVMPMADDAVAKTANRIWMASLASGAILFGVLFFAPDLGGQVPSQNSGWSGLLDLEKRFVLLFVGSLMTLVTGMLDSRVQWESGKSDYQWAQAIKKIGQ